MKGIKLLIVLAALGASSTTLAEIYKWKDANGHVHFSDQPPPDAVTTKLKGASSTATAAPAADASAPAPKTLREKEQDAKQRKAEQDAAAEKKKQEKERAEQKAQYCSSLRNNLAMLKQGGRVGTPNEKGELDLYSDDRIAKEIERLNDQIAKECSK